MAAIGEVGPVELRRRIERGEDLQIVDVREPAEVAVAPFPGAVRLPMSEIASRAAELDPARETVILCHHGIRSAQVAMYLASLGFERLSNLTGGIDAYARTADPSIPRY
jgi:rhodanese-related sulfurtransferase